MDWEGQRVGGMTGRRGGREIGCEGERETGTEGDRVGLPSWEGGQKEGGR